MTILPTTLCIHSRQMAKQSNYRWKYFSGSGHQTPFKICVVCTIATKISVLLCYLKQKSCPSVCLSVYRIFAGYLESVCVGRNLFWGKHNFSIWFFDVTYTSHTSVSPSVSLGLPWGWAFVVTHQSSSSSCRTSCSSGSFWLVLPFL